MFFYISEIYINFGILLKKRWASVVIGFWNYGLQKPRLLKCLKSPVSEHLLAFNMLKAPKICLKLHGSILVIFIDHSDKKWDLKIVS